MIKNLGAFAHPPKSKGKRVMPKTTLKASIAMANQPGMDSSDSKSESIGPDLMPAVKPSAPVIGKGKKKFKPKSKNPFFG